MYNIERAILETRYRFSGHIDIGWVNVPGDGDQNSLSVYILEQDVVRSFYSIATVTS